MNDKIKKTCIYAYYVVVAIILFFVVADLAQGATLQSKLKAYYSWTYNCTADDWIYKRHANSSSGAGYPTWGAGGKIGYGCDYENNGNTQYTAQSIPDSPIWDGDKTVSFWFKAEETGYSGALSGIRMDDTNVIMFHQWRDSDNLIFFLDKQGSNVANSISTGGGDIDTNWHHFVLVCKNGIYPQLWRDGVNMANGSSSNGACNNPSNPLLIGGAHTSNGMDGYLDEIGIFTNLTKSEILALYNSGKGCNPITNNTQCGTYTPPPAIIPNITISSTFPNNLNVTNSTLRFYFNGSVSNTRTNNINCSFRLNSTLNQSKNLVTITYRLNFSISTVGWNKGYTANISCKNNNASASLLRTFWVYQPYVPPEEEPEDNTTGSYAELIAVNNQIYEVLALIPFVLLWLGLWALGYHALQTNNTLLAGTMIILTLPLDFFFSYRFQETLMLGTGFLGIAFAVMTAWTIGIFVLLKRPVRG